jgi:RNA polymerase sigma-70 factor (ECF subfamily)
VAPDEVTELVATCLSEGRSRWPDVALSDSALRPHVHARIVETLALRAHVAALFVTVAASLGDAAAADWLHKQIIAITPSAIRRIVPASEADEVAQRVSIKLLVGTAGAARITSYAARGPIEGWLRAVITRDALTMRRRSTVTPTAAADEHAWLELPMLGKDPALLGTWRRIASEFRAVFEAALSELPTHLRLALRQHFIDGLSADELGRMYGVHRITAYRWIAEAKLRVLDRLRIELANRLDASPTEIDSLIRSVRSTFSITVERLVADDRPLR